MKKGNFLMSNPLLAVKVIHGLSESKGLAVLAQSDAEVSRLARYLHVSETQAVLFALIFQKFFSSARLTTSLEDLATTGLNCTVLELLPYLDDLDVLVRRRLICRQGNTRAGADVMETEYTISEKITRKITTGQPIKEQDPANIDILEILEELHQLVELREDRVFSTQTLFEEFDNMIDAFEDHDLFKTLKRKAIPIEEQICFCELAYRFIDTEEYTLVDCLARSIWDRVRHRSGWRKRMINGESQLEKKGLIALDNGDFSNDKSIMLSEAGFELILGKDHKMRSFFDQKDKKLTRPETIESKNLFYNQRNAIEIDKLFVALQSEKLTAIQSKLSTQNLPTGINILLHGSPGTGKTEMVHQLARKTGRPLMKVNVAETKSCWHGESEKMILAVFQDYEKMLNSEKIAPILFFNEADAILGKRLSVQRSIDQTTNAVQNILLEQLEKMNGIFIATTNLTDNLDQAFQRRFLFKVNVERPDQETRRRIWESKLPQLPKSHIKQIADRYELSGGEIDNIVRKIIMDDILGESEISLERLIEYCSLESGNGLHKQTKIGFTIS